MSARKTKKAQKAPKAPRSEGFHAPFAELALALEKKRNSAAKQPPAAPLKPATVPPAAQISDEEAFAAAYRGVDRLQSPAPAVRRGFTPDLDSIARHRQELDDLARGSGFDLTFHDHYVRARACDVSRETLVQLEKGLFAINAHLDLHGMVLEDARAAVDDFLREQQRRGHRCVLVVTGKGKNSPRQQGVLREKVPEWLARGPSSRRILAFVSARPCDGGVGALYVLMRRGSSRKNRINVELGGVGGLES